MSTEAKPRPLLRADAIKQLQPFPFRHPLNPLSEIHMVSLGDVTGLQRIGMHIARRSRSPISRD
jgi:hypothetical protein